MMIDKEKVIKGVHDARRYLEDREWVDKSVGVHIDALNDALALLKEQETEIDEIADEYLDLGSEMAKQPKIVRCKDCKHRNDDFPCELHTIGGSAHDDWFCADGVK